MAENQAVLVQRSQAAEKDGDECLTKAEQSRTLRQVFRSGRVSVKIAPLHKPKFLGVLAMAKPATLQIRLVSTADTGYFYVTKKNPRTKPEKLEVMKYDPRARKHVLFREAKIK